MLYKKFDVLLSPIAKSNSYHCILVLRHRYLGLNIFLETSSRLHIGNNRQPFDSPDLTPIDVL